MNESKRVGSNNSSSESSGKTIWQVFGRELPRKEIVFFVQVILLYIIIISSLINLTFYCEDNKSSQLWVALLSGSLGYLLPNPSLSNIRYQ